LFNAFHGKGIVTGGPGVMLGLGVKVSTGVGVNVKVLVGNGVLVAEYTGVGVGLFPPQLTLSVVGFPDADFKKRTCV
jgi:hypothetical protein